MRTDWWLKKEKDCWDKFKKCISLFFITSSKKKSFFEHWDLNSSFLKKKWLHFSSKNEHSSFRGINSRNVLISAIVLYTKPVIPISSALRTHLWNNFQWGKIFDRITIEFWTNFCQTSCMKIAEMHGILGDLFYHNFASIQLVSSLIKNQPGSRIAVFVEF